MAKKVRGRREKEKKFTEKVSDTFNIEEIKDVAPTPLVSETKEIPSPFYGLVDSSESAYFKEAESTLNVNLFENDEDKQLYVNSVFAESKGKELKLVTNQICSKLIERLILNGTPKQIKGLFKSLSGHFVALAHHKYASHCLETLCIRAASLIEQEIINDGSLENEEDNEEGEEELFASMETLFVYMVSEYKPYLMEMISHQYGSHVLRVVLLILAGKQLPSTTTGTSVLRSKKSKVARKMIEIKDTDDFSRAFQTPSSFKEELEDVLNTIRNRLTREKARSLAIEKVASPVMQLLIQVEGLVNRDRPTFNLFFEKPGEEADKQEGSYVEYLLSDSVGSHFLEAIIKYSNQKSVDRLYRLYMKERIDKLVRRQNTGLFVVEVLLFRLGKGEVKQMLDLFIPDIGELIDINLDLGKSIIDASAKFKNYKQSEIIDGIVTKYSTENSNMVEAILKLSTSTLGNTNDDWPTAEERWRALFFEKLVDYDVKLLNFALDSLMSLPKETLIQMCFHGVFSHVIESVLVVDNVDLITRRKFLNCFIGNIANLACNAYGSHVVDKFWNYTIKLTKYKEVFANELLNEKEKVKESMYGKMVWRNWKMDLFIRKRHDWTFIVKEQVFEKEKIEKAEKEKVEEEVKQEEQKKSEEEQKNRKRPNVGKSSGFSSKKPKLKGRNRS